MAYTFKELDPTLLAPVAAHIKDVLYPTKKWLGRKITPLVVLKDGRSLPLLVLMAKLKYGTGLDLSKQYPIWKDTNWYNATFENIELISIPDPRTKRAGRPPVHDIGLPSTHPDYHQRYMELTRERQREYRRKRYVRKRNATIELLDASQAPAPAPDDVFVDNQNNSMQDRLNDILLSTKIVSSKEVPTPKIDRPDIRWNDIAQTAIPSRFSKEFLDGLAAVPEPSENLTSSGAKK